MIYSGRIAKENQDAIDRNAVAREPAASSPNPLRQAGFTPSTASRYVLAAKGSREVDECFYEPVSACSELSALEVAAKNMARKSAKKRTVKYPVQPKYS